MMRTVRVAKELERIKANPPWGISCNLRDPDKLHQLEARIIGPQGSPYEGGVFTILIDIPEKYPFEPPQVKFKTPVYHPNIDKAGRICMDLIKMPPKGDWRPTVSLESLLLAVQLLLANPNPDDPLMVDIGNQYKFDRDAFINAAIKHTAQYAM